MLCNATNVTLHHADDCTLAQICISGRTHARLRYKIHSFTEVLDAIQQLLSAAMQLAMTLPRVPQDLFRLKKENKAERLSQIGKPTSKCRAAALHKKPLTKRHSNLMSQPESMSQIPRKRSCLMTVRMSDSDAQLQTLKQSLRRA